MPWSSNKGGRLTTRSRRELRSSSLVLGEQLAPRRSSSTQRVQVQIPWSAGSNKLKKSGGGQCSVSRPYSDPE